VPVFGKCEGFLN